MAQTRKIEVKEGKKPDREPKPDEIGKTQPKATESEGEVRGRYRPCFMRCWQCEACLPICACDEKCFFIECSNCGAINML